MNSFEKLIKDLLNLYPALKISPSKLSADLPFPDYNVTLKIDSEFDPEDWLILNEKGDILKVSEVKGAVRLILAEFIGVYKEFQAEVKGEPGKAQEEAEIQPKEGPQEQLNDSDKLAELEKIMDGEVEPVKAPVNTPSKRSKPSQITNVSIPESVRSKQISDLTQEDIKNYINPLATVQEAEMFLRLCQARGLNPFLHEAYLVKFSPNEAAQFVTGKETFTRRAENNPHVKGWKAGIIVRVKATDKTPAGKIEKRQGSFKLPEEELLGGWAEIHRDDSMFPFVYEVTLEEYLGRKKDGTVSRMWKEKPCTMIRKDALVGGLREAVTSEFGGMYDPVEMNGEVLEAVYQEVEA